MSDPNPTSRLPHFHFHQLCAGILTATLLQLRYPQALVVFYQYPTLFVQGKIGFDGLFLQLRLR